MRPQHRPKGDSEHDPRITNVLSIDVKLLTTI